MLGVGIIGAGLVGEKRAAHIKKARVVAVCDHIPERARKLADACGAALERDWQTLIRRKDIDIVCICTPHDTLTPCALAATKSGKHVLVEKPGGRNLDDLKALVHNAQESRKILRVGFNHRFHPAFQQAKELIDREGIGPLMYIRARYGHGGRSGYEKEWRADPARSGGGELMDQGVHLIDLCRWLGGEFELRWGIAKTFFWDMPVEDNGFLYLESPDAQRSAFLHASWTEWKNLFDFEIFGRQGKVEIQGLGRSYGPEELRVYRMKPQMGPPEMETFRYPEADASWQLEFDALLMEINGQRTDIATPEDALRAMDIVTRVYR